MSSAVPAQPVSNSQYGSFYIPSLDGIRAAAVLLVFLAHAGLNERVPGNFGVTVFFFLSGYLITTLLRMEFDKTGTISFKQFYLRRVLRIFPPFYLVLGIATLVTLFGIFNNTLHLDALFFQMFHLSNYYIIHAGWWEGRAAGTWIFWSLAVEEHFYLMFPILYLFLRRRLPSNRHQALVLIGICALVLLWRCILVFGLDAAKDRTYVATDTRMDSILYGCILAIFGNPMLDSSPVSDRWLKRLWIPLSITVLLVTFLIRDVRFGETFRYTLQGLALFPLFIAAIRYHNWGIFRLLNIGWIKFIGIISYSLYLVHPTILEWLHQLTAWHPIIQGIVGFGLTLLTSSIIYYLVEKPAARLRKRLSRVTDSAGRQKATHIPHKNEQHESQTSAVVPTPTVQVDS